MSLYNDLVRHEFGKGATVDELEGIQNRMDEAVSDLLLGISAIGSLMRSDCVKESKMRAGK
ncbi:hypothetical protein [Klebsiella pneumoniae]|uniref:hypothetical protein n=1 Tax=Klebsiella pneumoniae TaxID=573 RepID=UPI00298E59C0|nr:hypothetical protein [Klebsiella pneumoniae]MDW7253961.1 hypothetical protein [Klebsiella pneumoniae]